MRYFCLFLILAFLTACSPPAENAQVEVTQSTPVVQSSASQESSPEAAPSPSPTIVPSTTPSPTLTPSPTITPSRTRIPTRVREATPESTATPTTHPRQTNPSTFRLEAVDDSPFQGRMVAFRVENTDPGGYGLVLLDLTNGAYRYLWVQPPQHFPIGFSWAEDGCSFFTLTIRPGGFYVDEVDLYGNLLSRSEFTLPEEDIEKTITDMAPSPSGEWVAYNVHSGHYGLYFSDIQDVQIVPVDSNKPTPSLLSQGGWNYEPNWSSNGEIIAYADIDESGTAQLFIYDTTNGSKKQLTGFSSYVDKIDTVQWSPNDDYLATYVHHKDGTDSLWIVPTNGEQAKKANLEGLVPDRMIGWTDSGDRYVVAVEPVKNSETTTASILWIDARSGKISKTILLPEEHNHTYDILPVGDDQLFLYSGDDVYHLGGASGNQVKLGESPIGERQSIFKLNTFPRIRLGPPHFAGEENCEYP